MTFNVADYILTRLTEHQVDTLFGVPAVYCSDLFDAAGSHHITPIITASDLEAGYAADGYARTKGLGAVAVAYGVGTLSMINAIAGGYVERSPIVVINGGPTADSLNDLKNFEVVPSHSIGRPDTDLDAYKLVTADAARADKAPEVPGVVDSMISIAIRRKRPVYIEIDMGIWTESCPMPSGPLSHTNTPAGTERQLAATIVGLIRAAAAPLILVGAEIQRYGLADEVADLIAKLGVRWSTALLAKSTLAEQGDGWVGVFDPPHSVRSAEQAVENADLLVMLGCVFPTGYRRLVTGGNGRIVSANEGRVKIRGGATQRAEIVALVTALAAEAANAPPRPAPPGVVPAAPAPATGALTYRQVFDRISAALDASWIVIPDTCVGTFSAAALPVKGRDAFLTSGVWASIGHSVAAAVGASFGSSRRPLVICGDGGFHMTAQALSTMVRYGRDPVVVLIDNGIYAYEQFLIDPAYFDHPGVQPRPYVVLNRWDFVRLAGGLGVQSAQVVDTAGAFDAALAAAKASNAPALIVAQVDPHDLPAGLTHEPLLR
jgi:indolepyruvate decarboxylase